MSRTALPSTVTSAQIFARLNPGDCLLYHPQKFDLKHLGAIFGGVISFKTWHAISHCELYVGGGRSAASRDGIGVALYPWRSSELAYVLRPTQPLDWAAFWKWFRGVNGQKYDWFGLVRSRGSKASAARTTARCSAPSSSRGPTGR